MKFLIMLVVLIGLAAPSLSQSAAQKTSADDKLKSLPELRMQDFDGKPVKADSLKASVYVLDFWATWCTPCLKEIPTMNRLQESYADKGVKVVGVTFASGAADEVKPFVTGRNMKYTVLIGDDDQANDFIAVGLPTTYVVTGGLKIFKTYLGAGHAAEIEADIQTLLNQKK